MITHWNGSDWAPLFYSPDDSVMVYNGNAWEKLSYNSKIWSAGKWHEIGGYFSIAHGQGTLGAVTEAVGDSQYKYLKSIYSINMHIRPEGSSWSSEQQQQIKEKFTTFHKIQVSLPDGLIDTATITEESITVTSTEAVADGKILFDYSQYVDIYAKETWSFDCIVEYRYTFPGFPHRLNAELSGTMIYKHPFFKGYFTRQ